MIDDELRDRLNRFCECLVQFEGAVAQGAPKNEVSERRKQLQAALKELQKSLDRRSLDE
jgi:hypothetical protein